MNINRHNYEEFFLLYVDNELSAAEKSMVEVFLTNNPDLQEEMLMLQQSIVKPENGAFENKGQLLRSAVTAATVQEQLLLLLDNELPFDEKQQMQLLAEKDEAVKKEWDLLLQTQLSVTDTEIFEDKKSLYRKEEDGRVIPFGWWRIAAAAVLIGFGIWGTVSYINRGNTLTEVGGVAAKNEVKQEQPNQAPKGQRAAENVIASQSSTPTVANITNDNNSKDKKETAPADKINREIKPASGNNDLVQHPIKDNNLPKPDLQKINNAAGNDQDVASVPTIVQPATTSNTVTNINNTTTTGNGDATSIAAAENNDVHFASFDEDEEDRPKKTRIGGFFKKVKRVLARKTNIKTGNDDNIKIANMSFAMH